MTPKAEQLEALVAVGELAQIGTLSDDELAYYVGQALNMDPADVQDDDELAMWIALMRDPHWDEVDVARRIVQHVYAPV